MIGSSRAEWKAKSERVAGEYIFRDVLIAAVIAKDDAWKSHPP